MAKIFIHRKSGPSDWLRSYKIFIDDELKGKIEEKETKEFEIEPGTHQIYAKIDWFKSQIIDFNIQDDEEKHFEVVSNCRFNKQIIVAIIVMGILNFFAINYKEYFSMTWYFAASIIVIIFMIYNYISFYNKDKYIKLDLVE